MNSNLDEVECPDDSRGLDFVEKELEACRLSAGMDRGESVEERIARLELENRKWKSDYEALEDKFKALEAEKQAIEREVVVLKQKNSEIKERISGFEWTDGEFANELAHGVSRRKEMGNLKESCGGHWDARMVDLVDVGSGCKSCGKEAAHLKVSGEKEVACLHYGRRARKKLLFKEEESPSRKMASSTPGVAKPHAVGIIDIHDSDEEEDKTNNETHALNNQENSKGLDLDYRSYKGIPEGGKAMTIENSARTSHEEDYNDSIAGDEDNSAVLIPKRKRAFNVIETDSESGDDDCVPIGRLKRMHLQELYKPGTTCEMNRCQRANTSPDNHVEHAQTPVRRHLMTLREREAKAKAKRKSSSGVQHHRAGPTTEDAEDDDSEDFGLDSDNDSSSSFIVADSDVSHADDASDGDGASGQSEDTSDGETDFGEILSRIKRSKDHKSEWKFEADMLAAFGKEPELCMKAVCALYRQQTADEKISKEAFYNNQRGFSKFDAPRGCSLGEFLTDGDASGDLTKSVEELQEHDPEALDLCRKLADHYSKQLFQIYKNNEDPFFFPS
ncbi:uncharacterized protein LOC115686057 isoform X3 [Syzygium oleosum]|uniref:uncharacterized protein LOC115686057 isoform X3 n=1 Tax=Syzygium oleosum TaxID=219896 RepID=UPI0024B959A8|nr:uncharacterized protein LOC115686057 isoform X3 [Syzygium oleosum]